MATITGSNKNDTLTGTASSDIINSGNGDDIVNGGAGSDSLNGGAGSDILDGGSGSDQLNGGSGNDTLIYNVSENGTAGTKDVYTGGSGTDTVVVQFTLAQWLDSANQAQIAAYLAHLAAVTNAKTGEVSNGSASDFVFTFGSSTLTVQMMETLKVFVDGVVQNPADAGVLALDDVASTGEEGPNVNVYVLNNDLAPDLVKSLALVSAPAHGTAVLIKPDQATPSSWYFQYQANTAHYQYLAAGETAFDVFTYAVTDANGDTDTATVTITITGTNDAPTLSVADEAGAVTEDGANPTLSDSGTITFDDIDLSDAHTTSVSKDSGTLGGALLAVVSDSASGATEGAVTWSYSVANSATQHLGVGDTATETFTVTLSDGESGGTVSQLITVTVTGTNDAPTISTAVDTGAVTEDGSNPTLSTAGTITFDDIDLSDGHSVIAAAAGGNTLGGVLTASVSDAASGAGDGTVTWTYSVANAATQYLAAGETTTETFTITISDGETGTLAQDITITLTGSNDGVSITSAAQSATLTEDADTTASATDSQSAAGTISFTDLDLADTHTTTFAAAPANTTTLGAFALAPVSEAANATGGSLAWTYTLNNAAAQYLAAGETASETYTVTVDDGHGSTTTQDVVITITGTNDAPTISAAVDTGAVTEDGSNPTLSTVGTITFDDIDLSDGHSVIAAAAGGNTLGGVLTASVSDAASGAGDGTVTWSYSVANSATQHLGVGDTATETFTVTISDGETGGTVSQLITVTVTGTNDAPTLSVADEAGAVTEDGANPTLSDSGTITFDDIDLSDAHTTSVSKDSGTLGGALLAVVSDSASGATEGAVTWTYSVANSATQHLGVGDTATETFTVTISDGESGGTVSQLITVTVSGTNDAPVLTVDTGGALTEDLAVVAGNLSDSGTLSFTDVDVDDAVSVTSGYNGDALWSTGGALSAAQIAAITSGFTNDQDSWNYSVTNAALQFLGEGESITLSFEVTATDDSGAGNNSDTETVTLTITGTNDRPTLTITGTAGAMDEGNGMATLSDSAALSFADLDSTDVVTVSHSANGDIVWSNGVLNPGVAAALVAGFSVDQDSWNYSSSQNLDFLGAGETITFSYEVVATDDSGAATAVSASQTVTITLTGANDGVSITSAAQSGAVTEDADTTASATDSQSAAGTISFTDLDLADTHTTTFAAAPANTTTLGAFALAPVSEAANAAGGSLAWTYTLNNAAAQYLAAGETASETYTVTVDDGHGSTTTQDVVITITGTNDAPTISAAVDTGAVTEDGSNPTLSTVGTITFDDIDLSDGHSVIAAAAGGNTLGGVLTASVSDAASGAGDGTVTWTYSVANAATQYLAAGETTTETFTITISDGETGTLTQDITITLTGANDGVSITSAAQSGAVTEDADTTASATDSQSAAGTISFTDLDLADTHTTTFAAAPANTTTLGAFALAPVSEAANATGGSLAWTYTLNNAAAQYLAAGETASETYTVTVDDGHGSTTTQDVVITITGTNDAPTISAAVDTGAVTEDGSNPTLSTVGTITFDDIDLSDGHSVIAAAAGGNTLGGVLTASVSDAASGAGDGTVTWSYSVANSATQHLGVGDTATETFTVTISDGETGGTVSQLITVTVTGTNDAPTLSVADEAGAVTEDGANPTLSDSGTITFDDIDLSDAHTTSVSKDSGTLGGALLAVVSDSASGATEGAVTWTYSVANSATQHLGVGDTATETFTVTLSDGESGGTVSQLITVTVTGTNDAPTISTAVDTGAVTEDGSNPTLSTVGTITFDDIDLSDGHSVIAAAAGGNTLGGVLTASVSDAASGAGDGTVTWTYSVANAATQYLAAGETTTETFTITISDGETGTLTQDITITLTGANDGVSITSAAQSGAVTEDADTTASATDSQSAAGTISFTDLDLADTHTTTFAAAPANTTTLGAFALAPVSEAANAASGSLAWTYTLNNAAAQYLAAGETASETYTVTVDDGHGSTTTQDVVITITGSNDAPTISVADDAGAVTEDGANPTLSDSGTISFDDLDLSDAHTTSVSKDSGALGGALVALVSGSASGATEGAVTWSYSVANSATQHLGVGDTATETFTVTLSDGESGGTVSQLITVTVTGTNDAPVLNATAAPILSSIAEDAGAPSGAMGTLVSSLVDFNPPATGLNNVSDADSGAVTGIAITGANSGNGTWWHSTDNGGTWTQVGAVSNSSSLLLVADANTRVYFQGNSNFSGTVSDGITFRAWDQTSGTAGTKVSTSTNGASSAFSSATDTASITVSAVNDNPVAAADRIIVSNNTLVKIAVSALLANDTDIDGLALAITSVGSAVGISGLTLDIANGTISFNSGPTAGSFQYTVSDGAGGATTATATIDIRTVGGANTADTIDLSTTGTYQASFIDGRGGADILTGGAAGDVFIGGTGNGADTLTGSAGNDLLVGGDGNDTLSGGDGNDVLRGGIGNGDLMDGGAGAEDMLDFFDGTVAINNFTLAQGGTLGSPNTVANGTGGLGNNDTYFNMEGVIGTIFGDTINGSASNDIIRGGAGNDTLDGKAGSDLIDFSDGTAGITFTLVNNGVATMFNTGAAGLGADTYSGFEGVIGTAFADTLTGSASADQLRGGDGNDVINGLAGDNRIVGGSGADTLTGGTDNDIFVFNSAPNAVDSITGFDASGSVASGDLIELSLATFTAITTASGSTLSSTEFVSSNGGGAGDTVGAAVHVIYDSATGNLYYDSTGLSAADRTLVATLTLSNPADTFDNNDIWIGL